MSARVARARLTDARLGTSVAVKYGGEGECQCTRRVPGPLRSRHLERTGVAPPLGRAFQKHCWAAGTGAGRLKKEYRGLHEGFLSSCERFPERPALEIGGFALTYRQLRARAAAVAATLAEATPDGGAPLTAILGSRSPTAFAGVLGALMRGHGYVPLNPSFPPDRLKLMLAQSECRAVVVDGDSAALLGDVLPPDGPPLLLVLPDQADVTRIAREWPKHSVYGAEAVGAASAWCPGPVDTGAIAYLLFTSGSTGAPKGVMVTHRNAVHVVDTMVDRYGITEEDRLSQTFDLTFDLSVFDMFVTWQRAACLCCPSAKVLMAPGQFIRDSRLTLWFSVPSTAVFMRRLGMLKPNSYPTLRWSLFCGEPLTADVAAAWAAAAPASTVENLYGPTEVTIACTLYRWDPERSPADCELGVVPIGECNPDMEALVVDENLCEVPPGAEGELLMRGPQVTPGYWRDPERTAASFIVPPRCTERHYRTGDRVRRPVGDGPLRYIGRVDNQVKVNGHRVELGEVEAAVREVSGVDAVIALGWPPTPSGVGGIEAFLGDTAVDADAVRHAVGRRLPHYMVPRRLHLLPELPLNANGKYDRKALRARLDQGRRS